VFDYQHHHVIIISPLLTRSQERLIREIMAKDEVEWDDAKLKFDEIEQANKAFMGLHTLPYKVRGRRFRA